MSKVKQNPALAAILTICASAFVAGTTLLAKALGTGALGPELSALQVSQGRFMFAFLAIGLATAVSRTKLEKPAIGLHIGRSSLGWGGVTLMFAAAAYIPLSDATAISFLNPVFGMIFAIPFLGEKIGKWRWLSTAIAVLGAIVLMRPGAGVLEFGALLALLGALSLGAELIFIKKLSNRESPLQVLFLNNVIGLCIASCAASFVWVNPTLQQWLALAGVGFLMAAAQTCFINAMRRAEASFVSPFFYTTLVFAALYDGLVFGVLPDLISFLGAALILISAALLAWRGTQRKAAKA